MVTLTRKKRIAAEQKRAEKKAKTAASVYESTVKRYYSGLLNPERFVKQSVAIRLLQLIPTIIDNNIAEVEEMGIPCRDSIMLRKIREVQRPLESLLNYMRNDVIGIQKDCGRDDKTAKEFAGDWCDVANFIDTLAGEIVKWSYPNQTWRLGELLKKFTSLCTQDGEAAIVDECREICRMQLRRMGVNCDEAARQGIKPEDLNFLSVLSEEAKTTAVVDNKDIILNAYKTSIAK